MQDKESTPPYSFDKIDRMFTKAIGIGVYRFLLLTGVIALLYLNTKYVTVETYAAYKNKLDAELKASNERVSTKLETMEKSIGEINTTLKIMAQQDNVLRDHEQRIRLLENPRR